MPYIIGTAGHIDHGKTSLIKALTGQDTDRLKEEKERGISIDLGFAHFDLPDGTQAGVVDVPGHERFIRNMLAGAHGIDLVLFTVAADDGVMPQTEEHLDIVHLLGVKLAIFLITKADLVPPSRLQEVEEEIKILTLGTTLENSPVIPVSVVTGQGLSELRAELARVLQRSDKAPRRGYFRMPVDRVFGLQGHGLVVTGTAISGEVGVGDRVRSLPGDHGFRVRSVQTHNRSVERAGWGQRVALNLSGDKQDKAPLTRGDVICHEKLALSSDRFDAVLEVRPAAGKGIKNHQRIRLHAGTAERLGKLILLGSTDALAPKQQGYCQIVLAEPVMVLRGDRFIIRDETARRTLGGGMVIHPWAKRHKRRDPGLEARLAALRVEQAPSLIQTFLEDHEDFITPMEAVYHFLNVTQEEAQSWLGSAPGIRGFSVDGEKGYTTEAKWRALKNRILEALKEFHALHPIQAGRDMEELRAKLAGNISPKLFRELVQLMEQENIVARAGNLLRLPAHQVRLPSADKALSDKVLSLLAAQAAAPPDLKQLEKDSGAPRAKLSEVLHLMERNGEIARVSTDLYFPKDYIDKVKELLYKYLSENGEITAAGFRDLLGSSRKYTIALLEYFDREGFTIRIGDLRRLRSPFPAAGKLGAPR